METQQKTVAQEAYELLKDIPAENWITRKFSDDEGRCCLIGHYTRLKSGNPNDFSVNNCDDWNLSNDQRILRNATMKFLMEAHGILSDGAEVNNGPNVNGYTQPEIKDRCMALLEDMIKAGY